MCVLVLLGLFLPACYAFQSTAVQVLLLGYAMARRHLCCRVVL